MNLRPYQTESLDAVRNRTVDRGIIALPTGCGKSVVASEIHKPLGTDRLLYLAHREELITQLAGHCERVHGFWNVDIEQASHRATASAPIVVASVPTLAAGGGKRLKRLGKDRFGAVIVDEAHHATASSYLQIWRHLGILNEDDSKPASPAIPLIGLTATPGRGDGVGLSNVFDDILYQLKLAQAIRDGWLVPVHAWTIQTGTDLSEVRTRMGEFVESDLARAVGTEDRNNIILDACRTYAAGLKTLVFCVDIEHAENLAETFSAAGLPARAVHGVMRKDDRRDALEWFSRTPGAILTNCQLVTEGVDIPSVECVVMARPTKSATLYAQCLGRGTRLAKGSYDYAESVRNGKDRCILLDITDSIHGTGKRAVNVSDIFGSPLPDKAVSGSRSMTEIVEEQEAEVAEEERRTETERREMIGKTVDLFSGAADVPNSTFMWYGGGTLLRLNLGQYGVVTAQTDLLDRWSASLHKKDSDVPVSLPIHAGSQEEFVKQAEAFVRMQWPAVLPLIRKNAGWRSAEPSEKQLELCRKLRIHIPDGATKGDVSVALDIFFNQKK